MEQIHIKKFHTAAFTLLLEVPAAVFTVAHLPGGQLIGNLKVGTGMPLYHGSFQCGLAHTVQIGISGIKVGAATSKELVNHGLQKRPVYALASGLGQPQKTKAKFVHAAALTD